MKVRGKVKEKKSVVIKLTGSEAQILLALTQAIGGRDDGGVRDFADQLCVSLADIVRPNRRLNLPTITLPETTLYDYNG